MNCPPANSSPTGSLLDVEAPPRDVPPALAAAQKQSEQEDIYRGEPPSPPRSPPPPFRPPSPASSSSSSSGWSGLGLRRGALGAILELAINRWARSSRDSSATSSSSSSLSSVHTRMPRRRKRPSSIATSHNTHSENIIRARRMAREEGRVLPRDFVLFLPTALAPVDTSRTHPVPPSADKRIFCTTSLPLTLAQLDSAIKRSARSRKLKQHRDQSPARPWRSRMNDYMIPEALPQTEAAVGKGKARDEPRMFRANGRAPAGKSPQRPAWWLDVTSPTWSDLREIGKLLHIHPLTLEDILHRDPREKLELFPRLGYYFIVFRALESEYSRVQSNVPQHNADMKNNDPVPFIDGTVGAANVYIVVFREGICTFHFENISNHTSRVRNRIIQLEEIFDFSADWIAHGILDSIVDHFFPLLDSIELEVKNLDDLVLSIDGSVRNLHTLGQVNTPADPVPKSGEKNEKSPTTVDVEKTLSSQSGEAVMLAKPVCCAGFFSWALVYMRRLISTFAVGKLKTWSRISPRPQEALPLHSPLMRMTSTRRLVTSLTRLLGTKSEVVSQIRKRLNGSAVMGLEVGPSEKASAAELGIYLGDIQDHILTLHQSLAHYERMLSHSHPAYLSHLRVSLSQAKAGMDKALFMLTVLGVAILTMTLVTGLFSVNLGKIPRNRKVSDPPNPPAPFNAFLAVVAGDLLMGACVVTVTRYWWVQAERKYARRPKF